MAKKRKRRISRDELRQMAAPTEDFEFADPKAVRLLDSATLKLAMAETAQASAESVLSAAEDTLSKRSESEEDVSEAEDVVSEAKKVLESTTEAVETAKEDVAQAEQALESAEVIVLTARQLSRGHLTGAQNNEDNLVYAAEIASKAIIDDETHKTLYTPEDCLAGIPPITLFEIANYGLTGERTGQEGQDAEDVDRFPENPNEGQPGVGETSE